MFSSPADVIDALAACPAFSELLERDLKNPDKEVGFSLGERGTVFQFRDGRRNEITFVFPPEEHIDEQRAVVHTHPSLDATMSGGVTMSERDIALGEHYAVCAMVALSKEMFGLQWYGEAVLFDDDGSVAGRQSFEVTADGVSDGPKDERYVENVNVEY